VSDLKLRAVVAGLLVDTAGTLVVALLLNAVVAVVTGATTPEDLATIFAGSVELQTVQLALGIWMTLLGAYVAARMVPGAERLHAFAVGVASTGLGFLFVFSAPEAAPFWMQAAGLILTIPAAYAGGEIRRATATMKQP